MRKYVFADEAGNFDFSDKDGASLFFILATVTADSPDVGDDLLKLRRTLAWDGIALESNFHATEDAQAVRDQVQHGTQVIPVCGERRGWKRVAGAGTSKRAHTWEMMRCESSAPSP